MEVTKELHEKMEILSSSASGREVASKIILSIRKSNENKKPTKRSSSDINKEPAKRKKKTTPTTLLLIT